MLPSGQASSGLWNWDALRERIRAHGVRNSLLLAPMPTASTSQILGNNECFEPYTSNIYVRRVLQRGVDGELAAPRARVCHNKVIQLPVQHMAGGLAWQFLCRQWSAWTFAWKAADNRLLAWIDIVTC